jgi:hypothetical protein
LEIADVVTGIAESNTAESVSETPCLSIYPNPFRGSTTINFQTLPPSGRESSQSGTNSKSQATIEIYNAAGRLVKKLNLKSQISNLQSITWSGTDHADRSVPGGVYFVQFEAGDYKKVEKVLLLR